MKQLLENWNKYLRDNDWKYRILTEAAFSRIVTDYGDRGYIIVTSDRSCEGELGLPPGKECSEKETAIQDKLNSENMPLLLADIRSAGFGYIPTLGGYKEDLIDPKTGEPVRDEEGNVIKVDTDRPENSVIVVARPEKGRDHEVLKELGTELAATYNQDSFFYKPPDDIDEGAYWIKPDGSVDMSFEKFTVNDLNQQFYTQMARGPRHRFTALDEGKEMIFRVRTSPTSTAEARNRYGEIFMKFSK
tara:strand:- start:1297 stop:2034 length:738 start_codon:yes stop_codon:yes gene_type:complete